ncbi:hypothetical protein DTO271D3_1635 [Paecilomyces variotii]|nr:hypothetical protein DTO169C6_4123 [Paecilomyces variotii]KAJ9246062.1 hypothetical protein DTO169E5_186 [Paecilomyces variotii]KAJ9259122.1 hypothetical protein DTO207G8_1282 [Paecilomyces variotii]KAJ9318378.1 hypothetical protein DTO271D3_1635 [Paecilomyces variotii]KAJ9383431.1 hypothetical protein DTO063F5_5267 [Paecilomyces variotii]
MADLSPGQVVTLTDGRQATVRFIGSTHFAPGDWIGIELDEPTGKNDGAVQGERYFECEHGFGMFIRPSAVLAVVEQPKRESKPPPKAAAPATRRPQSTIVPGTAGARRPSVLGPTAKRQSVSGASPSPAPRVAPGQRTLRSPTKSPTKQLGITPASRASSTARTSIAATKSRPSVGAKTTMGPPQTPSAAVRATRQPLTGPASKVNRPSVSGLGATSAGLAKRPSIRTSMIKKATEGAESGGSATPDDVPEEKSPEESPRGGHQDEVGVTEASNRSPAASRTANLRASLSPGSQRTGSQNAAVARELEDLKTKLKVMEKKRAEDREKLKGLEQLQSERDKFEAVIQKLQTKYQPQQLEIGELRKQLKEAESRLEEAERLQAEHDSILEMAALDREMAEEMADAYKHELEALKLRVEELEMEVEVLREENEELGQVMSPEEKSSQGWLQMERTNERLREALIRLRDMTQQQESDLKDQIKELESDLEEYASVKAQYETTKEKLLVSETNVEDLKQQLETALGAEEMIEELADKNMRYQEEINELKAAIEDLESLKEINDELEINHIETEKQLQEEIDYRESIFNEQCRKVAQQDELIEDLEYTLSRFRELVSNLQNDLEDMRASQQLTETEASELTVRSRAMIDLNMKLQASVAKAQTKTIDVELSRMESEESAQHLAIVKLYLPEYYESERNSILALLRFKRVSFKASLMGQVIRERVSDQSAVGTDQDEIFTAYEVLEKLQWISLLCERFVNFISTCSVEEFSTVPGALYELEPVERTLNTFMDGLKKNELNEKKCAVELQRSIALLSHLAETLIPPSLETFADEIYMRSMLTQCYLDHAGSSILRIKSVLQAKLPEPTEQDEEGPFIYNKLDSLATQARGLKVVVSKIARSLEELKSRSLALSGETAESFEKAEAAARELSELIRQLGENAVLLVNEEGRTAPFTYSEIMSNMSQTAASLVQPSAANSDGDDALNLLAGKIRTLGEDLEELSGIATDLSLTTEFERRPSPWIARAQELKSNKTISPDADEEIRRLKNEINEASTALGVKDKTLEEQAIKVEHLESRMRDASKKAAMVKELEAKFEEMQAREIELSSIVENQKKELESLETERDELKSRLERAKRMSGSAAAAAAGEGAIVDNAASLAAIRENESLRAEVDSLQAAVRFLREENRRANLLDPYSVQRSTNMYSWLDVPLAQTKHSPEQERMHKNAAESRDVLTHLLKLTKESRVPDLKSTLPPEGSNRLAWRPAKTTYRYQVLQQRENFERWVEWKDDVAGREREQDRIAEAKRQRALREKAQKQASGRMHSSSLSYGMMGRAWEILGIKEDHRKDASGDAAPGEVQIVTDA